jgi:uncharacterized protein (UPF0335 family)
MENTLFDTHRKAAKSIFDRIILGEEIDLLKEAQNLVNDDLKGSGYEVDGYKIVKSEKRQNAKLAFEEAQLNFRKAISENASKTKIAKLAKVVSDLRSQI